ncbi:MAG: excinuclease ABC subunit B, partial [Elusimicrobia bacterium]|nr:excinuclease ABC subunit B [Elusimicrobiota bacterium]
MLCSDCQTREAQVYFKQIVNSQVTQRALCQECAASIGVAAAPSPDAMLMQVLSGLGSLLTGAPVETRRPLQCSTCGLKWTRFEETGRLGCADCYESFRVSLGDLLRRVHGSDQHRGKLPKGSREAKQRENRRDELARLERALKAAIDGERFEEAA